MVSSSVTGAGAPVTVARLKDAVIASGEYLSGESVAYSGGWEHNRRNVVN